MQNLFAGACSTFQKDLEMLAYVAAPLCLLAGSRPSVVRRAAPPAAQAQAGIQQLDSDAKALYDEMGGDAIKARKLLDVTINKEGLAHGPWVSKSRAFDDDRIQRFALPLAEFGEDIDEIATDCAAHAAVIHFKDLFIGIKLGFDQRFVHAHFTKLILDYCELLTMVCS